MFDSPSYSCSLGYSSWCTVNDSLNDIIDQGLDSWYTSSAISDGQREGIYPSLGPWNKLGCRYIKSPLSLLKTEDYLTKSANPVSLDRMPVLESFLSIPAQILDISRISLSKPMSQTFGFLIWCGLLDMIDSPRSCILFFCLSTTMLMKSLSWVYFSNSVYLSRISSSI